MVPEDKRRLKRMMTLSHMDTLTDVVKASVDLMLRLHEEVKCGNRPVVRHRSNGRQFELAVYIPQASGLPLGQKAALDIRLSPAMDKIVHHLIEEGVAANRAYLIRHALQLYSEVITKLHEGWELVVIPNDQEGAERVIVLRDWMPSPRVVRGTTKGASVANGRPNREGVRVHSETISGTQYLRRRG